MNKCNKRLWRNRKQSNESSSTMYSCLHRTQSQKRVCECGVRWTKVCLCLVYHFCLPLFSGILLHRSQANDSHRKFIEVLSEHTRTSGEKLWSSPSFWRMQLSTECNTLQRTQSNQLLRCLNEAKRKSFLFHALGWCSPTTDHIDATLFTSTWNPLSIKLRQKRSARERLVLVSRRECRLILIHFMNAYRWDEYAVGR